MSSSVTSCKHRLMNTIYSSTYSFVIRVKLIAINTSVLLSRWCSWILWTIFQDFVLMCCAFVIWQWLLGVHNARFWMGTDSGYHDPVPCILWMVSWLLVLWWMPMFTEFFAWLKPPIVLDWKLLVTDNQNLLQIWLS